MKILSVYFENIYIYLTPEKLFEDANEFNFI